MKNILKIIAAIVATLFITGASFTAWSCYRIYFPYQSDDTQQEFVVQKGDGVNQITARLAEQGLIPHNFYIDTYLWLIKSEGKLKPGTYSLAPSMSAQEIADKLVNSETSSNSKVVIPEGWTRENIAEVFTKFHIEHYQGTEDIKLVESQFEIDFLRQSNQADKYRPDYDFLTDLPQGATLEGYLFPDTYEVYGNATPEEIVRKMLDNFAKKVDGDFLEDIKGQDKTVFEVVNLAAIVEREVRKEEEMKKVAGVYQNRLDADMKLQSDATITFITKKKDPQPTYEDTRIASPYNTYLHEGLPPAPIGNPGLQAIKAAVDPAEHDYLYFITKLDTGEAVFAETVEEHGENKERYLK